MIGSPESQLLLLPQELETQLAEVEGDLASLEGAQVVHLMQPRA